MSIGGMAGAFMTGLFCQKSVNVDGGADGAFYGRPIQLGYQIAGILTAIGKWKSESCEQITTRIEYPLFIYFFNDKSNNNFVVGFAAVCTAGILLPLHWTIGIRLTKEEEIVGLDATGTLFCSAEIKDK